MAYAKEQQPSGAMEHVGNSKYIIDIVDIVGDIVDIDGTQFSGERWWVGQVESQADAGPLGTCVSY